MGLGLVRVRVSNKGRVSIEGRVWLGLGPATQLDLTTLVL